MRWLHGKHDIIFHNSLLPNFHLCRYSDDFMVNMVLYFTFLLGLHDFFADGHICGNFMVHKTLPISLSLSDLHDFFADGHICGNYMVHKTLPISLSDLPDIFANSHAGYDFLHSFFFLFFLVTL